MDGKSKKKHRHERHDNRGSNSSTSATKSKKLTKVEHLIQAAENADEIMRTAKKTLADKKKTSISKMELDLLEQTYKNAKNAAAHATSVATAARIAKRKANERAEQAAALEKIYENDERYLEEEEKGTKGKSHKGLFINTSLTEKAYADFLAKQALEKAIVTTRTTKRNANLIRRERIKNISRKTKVKRINIEALLPNVNAEGMDLEPDEIAHIISLAHGAKTDVATVLEMIQYDFPYESDVKLGVTTLKLADALNLELSDFRKSVQQMMDRGVPFQKILQIIEDIPKNTPISNIIGIVELTYKSGVPVNIAIDFEQAESVRNAFSMKKRIKLLRLAYLSGIDARTMINMERGKLNNSNIGPNGLDLPNARKLLEQIGNRMKNEGLTLENILEEKRQAERNMLSKINRTELIHTVANKTKKKGKSYASIAATMARRKNNVKDTFEAILVRGLPIKEIPIHEYSKSKDLAPIISKIKGALASNRIFPGKASPGPKDVRIAVPLTSKTVNGEFYEVPKGYAIVRFIFREEGSDTVCNREKNHTYAKGVMEYMDSSVSLPTYGKDHIIQKKDVEPVVGNEYYIDSETCSVDKA